MKTSSVARRFPQEREKQADRWRWAVAVLVSMAVFLDTVDVSIINVALPNLQRDLQFGGSGRGYDVLCLGCDGSGTTCGLPRGTPGCSSRGGSWSSDCACWHPQVIDAAVAGFSQGCVAKIREEFDGCEASHLVAFRWRLQTVQR